MSPTTSIGRVRRPLTLAMIAAAAAFALVACSAGGGSADPTPTGDLADPAGIAEATALMEELRERPTQIPQTVPIDAEIPDGKVVYYISCGVATCELQGDILSEAAEILGWSVKSISTDGSAEKVQAALDQAIREGADGIIYTGVERSIVSAQIAAAEAADIPIAVSSTTGTAGEGITYSIYNTAQAERNGEGIASWVVGDSQGGANILFVNLSAFEILTTMGNGFKSAVEKWCSDCTITDLDIPLSALGTDSANRVASALRSNPDVDYIVASNDLLISGLPAILDSLDIDVKIIGAGGTTENFQYIATGKQTAELPFSYHESDYAMMDALARHFAGVPQLDEPPLRWIVTEATLPTESEIFPIVEDYKEQYAVLWGKG